MMQLYADFLYKTLERQTLQLMINIGMLLPLKL